MKCYMQTQCIYQLSLECRVQTSTLNSEAWTYYVIQRSRYWIRMHKLKKTHIYIYVYCKKKNLGRICHVTGLVEPNFRGTMLYISCIFTADLHDFLRILDAFSKDLSAQEYFSVKIHPAWFGYFLQELKMTRSQVLHFGGWLLGHLPKPTPSSHGIIYQPITEEGSIFLLYICFHTH